LFFAAGIQFVDGTDKEVAMEDVKSNEDTATSNHWVWYDPDDTRRFRQRVASDIPKATHPEGVLQNIVKLTDDIYGHLSVYEQFYANPEGGGRGGRCAAGDPTKKLSFPDVHAELLAIEARLRNINEGLMSKRERYVGSQLEALGISEQSEDLKIHLGSAGILIEDWINVDAGGADLMLNATWGLPFPDASVRFLYCSHMLEHLRFIDQMPDLLREVFRVMAPGGTARFVVPDIRKLVAAYINGDTAFFDARKEYYPVSDGFLDGGVTNLDYILFFCGAAHQVLNYHHKFGYDTHTLCRHLRSAGFSEVMASGFQESAYAELRVDDQSYNSVAADDQGNHFSLFVEATK
jgi:SAM-dependent methyltransferase